MPRPRTIKLDSYDPFVRPVLPPESTATEAPTVCVELNEDWLAYISGAILRLTHADAWKGTNEQITHGVNQAWNIINALYEDACMSSFQLRQKPDDDCVLQQSLDGGATWEDAFDYSLCASPSTIIYNQDIALLHSILEGQYDGTPESIDPDAPDTNLNSDTDDTGSDSDFRLDALCWAAGALVDYFVEVSKQNLSLVDNVLGFITPYTLIFGPAIAAIGFVFGMSSKFLQQIVVGHLTNEDAIEAARCAVFDAMIGIDNTPSSWANTFEVARDASDNPTDDIIQYMINGGVGSRSNYLMFQKLLAQGYRLAKAEVLEPCPCLSWEKPFFGGAGNLDGMIAFIAGGGEYDAVNDWAVGTLNAIAGPRDYVEIWLYINFPEPVRVTRIRANIEVNNPDGDGSDEIWSIRAYLPEPPITLANQVVTIDYTAPLTVVNYDSGDIDLTAEGWLIRVTASVNDSNPGVGVARIKSLIISGSGFNPWA